MRAPNQLVYCVSFRNVIVRIQLQCKGNALTLAEPRSLGTYGFLVSIAGSDI